MVWTPPTVGYVTDGYQHGDDMENLLTAIEVANLLRISRVHVWRRVKAGHLPAPIYIAPRAPRWRSDEIDAVIEKASAARAA